MDIYFALLIILFIIIFIIIGIAARDVLKTKDYTSHGSTKRDTVEDILLSQKKRPPWNINE